MRAFHCKNRGQHRQAGQALLMFAFFMIVLIAFIGLGIDLGFAYLTKAQLSKGVDAAALAGMLNFAKGQAVAQDVASATFAANYRPSGRDAGTVTPTITFSNDTSNGNSFINVSATSRINTFFIRVMPVIGGADFSTLQVGANSQATRSRLIMSLVLDRSGSMDPVSGSTEGGKYLPGAVTNFVSFFEEGTDTVSMVSFASTVTNNVPMTNIFKTAISTAAINLPWAGGTFSPGGLTNALALVNGVAIPRANS